MSERKSGDPISFRLSPSEEERLAQAAENDLTTIGDYARKLVREGLSRGLILNAMMEEIETLNRNFVNATLALLVNAGRCSAQQANDWVEQNLKK